MLRNAYDFLRLNKFFKSSAVRQKYAYSYTVNPIYNLIKSNAFSKSDLYCTLCIVYKFLYCIQFYGNFKKSKVDFKDITERPDYNKSKHNIFKKAKKFIYNLEKL